MAPNRSFFQPNKNKDSTFFKPSSSMFDLSKFFRDYQQMSMSLIEESNALSVKRSIDNTLGGAMSCHLL